MNMIKVYAFLLLALPSATATVGESPMPTHLLLQLVLEKHLKKQQPVLGNKKAAVQQSTPTSNVRRIAWQALKAGTMNTCRCQFCKPVCAKL